MDASGRPVKVAAPADLPEAVRSYIEKRVASWQYTPGKVNGVPQPSTTYVRVGACAIPAAGGYRLGLDFKGNGPMAQTKGPWFLPHPPYPRDMLARGAGGAFKVTYAIQKDGRARVLAVETLEGTDKRHAKGFHSALKSWIEDLRYLPEQVGGMPVETEMSFPVSFVAGGSRPADWRKAYAEELQARALASKECIAAGGSAGPLPIAINSPVTVVPSPAG